MMTVRNEASRLRMDLSIALSKAAFDDELELRIDRLPLEFRPKGEKASRCCIYRDRAIIRYRLMALLGHAVEEESDEAVRLSEYARQTLESPSPSEHVLTILDIACSSCEGGGYVVTDLCRGCLARPCMANCPRDAIKVENGRAEINRERCVNCGKCRDVCPFNAVSYQTVPCEASCPVDAIAKDESGVARIDWERCILCGRCSRSCPFGAVMERSSLLPVIEILKDRKAVALVAPSIAGQFPGRFNQLVTALRELGFSHVYEVAAGAEKTAAREAKEFLEKREGEKGLLGTSCCPAYIQAVRKHVPEFEPSVSTTPTPMNITGQLSQADHPDVPRVFIGPCVAKRFEAQEEGSAEYVMTFEELGALFLARDIAVEEWEESEADLTTMDSEAWGFARAGGVAGRVVANLESQGRESWTTTLISGMDRKAIAKLRLAASGKGPQGLLEVMACDGGCLHGPGTLCHPGIASKALDRRIEEGRSVAEKIMD